MTTFKVYTLQPPIPLQDQKYQHLFSYHVSSTKSPPTVGIYCKSLFHPKILVFQLVKIHCWLDPPLAVRSTVMLTLVTGDMVGDRRE